MPIKISKQNKVKHFLECNIEKFSSKFNFKTNLNYLKDLEEDTKFLNETLTIPQGVNAVAVGPITVTSGNTLTIEGDVVIL